MKKNGKLIAACAAVVVLVVVLVGIYRAARPAVSGGDKTITVEVVHKDGDTKTFTYQTEAGYLGEVLLAEGLIEGEMGPYGLYIQTVDGERAVYEEDGSYWSLYEGDSYAEQGVDLTPIEDGGMFSLVYTVG